MGAEKSKKKRSLILVISVIALVVVASAIILGTGAKDNPIDLEIPIRSKGSANAIVVLEEYADYGCITCRVWHQMGIVDQILEEYDGLVRFDWYDFPVITSDSPMAAEAGLCAHEEGMFWEYHDLVYKNYPLISEEHLKQYATEIGLNSQEFAKCLDSGKYQPVVKEEINTGHRLGLRSTPSFRINETILIGLPTYDILATTIDEVLEENQSK
jgi:protein-disulfide isomerase